MTLTFHTKSNLTWKDINRKIYGIDMFNDLPFLCFSTEQLNYMIDRLGKGE